MYTLDSNVINVIQIIASKSEYNKEYLGAFSDMEYTKTTTVYLFNKKVNALISDSIDRLISDRHTMLCNAPLILSYIASYLSCRDKNTVNTAMNKLIDQLDTVYDTVGILNPDEPNDIMFKETYYDLYSFAKHMIYWSIGISDHSWIWSMRIKKSRLKLKADYKIIEL